MKATSVKVTRIMLRDRGAVSDISIEGELVIEQDDPMADSLLQPIAESLRVSTLPANIQDAIRVIQAAAQTRLEQKYKLTTP
tara:strand:- start:12175 stop:12420 length:246 start_codon:yes stop_codon:yes gene_type:complete